MKAGVVESKFKYMLGKRPLSDQKLDQIVIGEPFKEKFEGITINDAASEGNFIRSNGIFTAVIETK